MNKQSEIGKLLEVLASSIEDDNEKIIQSIRVPEKEIVPVLTKLDAMKNGGKLERYQFWKYLEVTFPETKHGHWKINTGKACEPVLEMMATPPKQATDDLETRAH